MDRRVFLALVLSPGVFTGCDAVRKILGLQNDDTDRIVWTVAGYTNNSVPWYDDSVVYFLGKHHEVTAVRKKGGTILWTALLPVERDRTVGFRGLVESGRVVVGDQDLFALDATDGRILWRFAWSTSIDIGRDISEYWNGLVFTGSSNGYVLGVDVASGELRWATRLATNPKVGTYVGPISDGTLFVTLTDFLNFGQDQPLGGVAALDALTGDVKWLQMLPHDVNPDGPTATIDPVVAGDVVAAGSRDGPLYAYDRATGVLRWKAPSVPVGAADPMDVTDVRPLAACDGLIFAGSTSGILVALDPATGRERWRTRPAFWGTDGWVYCDERTVYAFYPYGQLEAFNSVDGSRRWEITDAPNHHFSVGGVADALFFYSGGLNGLYAIRK